jgi:hypothetical protein
LAFQEPRWEYYKDTVNEVGTDKRRQNIRDICGGITTLEKGY